MMAQPGKTLGASLIVLVISMGLVLTFGRIGAHGASVSFISCQNLESKWTRSVKDFKSIILQEVVQGTAEDAAAATLIQTAEERVPSSTRCCCGGGLLGILDGVVGLLGCVLCGDLLCILSSLMNSLGCDTVIFEQIIIILLFTLTIIVIN
jgi:hypothetical protein